MDGKKILMWGGIATLIVGIGMWAKKQMNLASQLIFGTRNVRLKKVTATDVVIELDLTIDNPSVFNATIYKIDINVFANGVKATNILNEVQVAIMPNAKIGVPLKMSFNPKDLGQNVGVLFSTGFNIDNVVLTFRGVLKISKNGIPLTIPILYTSTYKELLG